ncbi:MULTISPECIES: polysaccharide deacetylase family protein [unclassified Clostridioides]|uniref:polysaccharide deacetylase family protein n=1 Tax=unclassified Clostridioides TaxID=2635829 RepID=UPI001D108DE7|nr:polysaccharide deacetylase [Clostridioides sp. ZZV14-6150]MCC0659473.1 polysaccharide deacetylase [Clostridioides sp. ZZV14-6154]MCC0667014.1 polysaccharide deacetylase [Clostridioides sp. ZZV14-6153]MCC0718710.1 polysaccharide deacetylase [Clostridioides sp. ZZV14-6105]MCC0723214.1 polysaccharide deacetylase [Clostridioides sp. ZZV14-6104]MCC0726281.1 polysaccharide deacetylase [Clostridioides sp. ZZV14-6045]MCC0729477.1 polysaccharide deacetylase [Clostridioides sp. ZZV14-6048]MCC073377
MVKKRKKKTMALTIIVVIVIGIFSMAWADMSKKREIKETQEKLKAEKLEKERIEKEKNEPIIGAKKEAAKEYGYDAKLVWDKLNKYDYSNNGEKIVFLTFDDGPSTTNTPQVLDILKRHDVKGTFFIKGDSLERKGANEILKRTFDEGNAIAHHSYSHDYKKLYPGRSLNLDTFVNELNKTDEAMKKVLGKNFSSHVVRCPGGYMSWKNMEPLGNYLKEKNMASIDWNALNADAEGKKKNAQELFEHAKKSSEGKEMVVLLMHDTYGKQETVNALDQIITYFKDNGYQFKTLI